MIKKFFSVIALMLDPVFGALVGLPCDLCRTPTMCKTDWIRWCPLCFASEFRRWGL